MVIPVEKIFIRHDGTTFTLMIDEEVFQQFLDEALGGRDYSKILADQPELTFQEAMAQVGHQDHSAIFED